MSEPQFKPKGNYLGRCHQWVSEPAPDGYLPGWSAASECWWVRLRRPDGGRWIIAGFERDAVVAAMTSALGEGMTEWEA